MKESLSIVKIVGNQHWYRNFTKSIFKYKNVVDVDARCGARGALIHCWWGSKMVQPLWKTVWQFLAKLHTLLSWDPAIMLLGSYPKELKTYVHTETYAQMFIAALFRVAKTQKQPGCPSVGKWINQLWSIQTMQYYSRLKRNDLSEAMERHGGALITYD